MVVLSRKWRKFLIVLVFVFYWLLCLHLNWRIVQISNDKELVVEQHNSIEIGCKHNRTVTSCSISKTENSNIVCSITECNSINKIKFTGHISKSFCEFELKNADSQGKSFFNKADIVIHKTITRILFNAFETKIHFWYFNRWWSLGN